jgi:hypothetical protein
MIYEWRGGNYDDFPSRRERLKHALIGVLNALSGRAMCQPLSAATDGQRRPDHAQCASPPVRWNQSDCPAHRRWFGSWCSIHRESVRSLRLGRLFSPLHCADGLARWCCRSSHINFQHRPPVAERSASRRRLCPAAEASIHVLPIAEAFRQATPGDPLPIASRLSGQQVMDAIPLVIAKAVAALWSSIES